MKHLVFSKPLVSEKGPNVGSASCARVRRNCITANSPVSRAGLGVGLTCFECDGANDERCNENEGWATTQVDTRTCVAKSDGFEFFRCYVSREQG